MAINVLRGPQRLAGLPFLAAHTLGDLQARLDRRDLRGADPLNRDELADGRVINSPQPAELTQEQTRVIDCALAGAGVAISQDNREKFSFAKRLGAFGEKFFSRSIFFGPIFDGLV